MLDELLFQLEVGADAATVYLCGAPSNESLARLGEILAELPSSVRYLHLDLRAMVPPGSDALAFIQSSLGDWRESRGSESRLSFSTHHLAVDLRARGAGVPSVLGTSPSADLSPAHMATYL